MDSLTALQIGGKISWGLFIFAVGACVGSLTNVLVYRLPLGLDVILAPSRCPVCATRLGWRENVPVLGWLLLRGKCRFCKSTISPEYPLVETMTGLLFFGVFSLWFLLPNHAVWLGIDWGAVRPDWAMNDAIDGFPRLTWGPLVAVLVLMGSLTAMTLIDAKTFMIPLPIPWFATGVGVFIHTVGALVAGPLLKHAPGTNWAIPQCGGYTPQTPDGWWWIGATMGAIAGLVVSMILLHYRLIRRSFEDYQEWEDRARTERAPQTPTIGSSSESGKPADHPGPGVSALADLNVAGPVGEGAGEGAWLVIRFLGMMALGIAGMTVAGWWWSSRSSGEQPEWIGLAAGVVVSPILAGVMIQPRASRLLARRAEAGSQADSGGHSQPELWIRYPHARREMIKELIFLTPCIGLAWLGGWAASHLGSPPGKVPPFWLVVLCGTLLGYLAGGGIVWGVRILGSLAFGKEAMGLGDVHLLAAVGACVGWIDALLALPIAAVVALYSMVVGAIITRAVGRTLPFGPYLAGATVIIVAGKPLIESGLSWLYGQPVNLP